MSSILIRTKGQLSPYLKSLRRLRGWSQEQRGNKIGLSQERIVKIENAPEKVRFDVLLTIRIFARRIAEWSPRLKWLKTPPVFRLHDIRTLLAKEHVDAESSARQGFDRVRGLCLSS